MEPDDVRRSSSIAPDLPSGYVAHTSDGLAEIVETSSIPWRVLVGVLGAAFVVAGPAAVIVGGWDAASDKPWIVLALVVSGAALLLAALLENTWIVGAGTIARGYRVRLLNRSWKIDYSGARKLEIVHEMWHSGRGSSDQLILLTSDYRRIPIYSVAHRPKSWISDQPVPIESVALALGQYLSARSGLPLTVREYGIEEPIDLG